MKMFRCMIAGATIALALFTGIAFADARVSAIQVGYMAAYTHDFGVEKAVALSQSETRTAALTADAVALTQLTLHAGYIPLSNGAMATSTTFAGQGVWLTCRTVA